MTASFIRRLLVIAALGLLSACNVVLTKDPLFTLKDAAGAPPLRHGVWMFFKEDDCKVDESKPFTEWPDCAGGGLVSDEDVAGRKANAQPDQLEHMPYVLAAGDPRIIQIPVDFSLSVQATASASGGAEASASPPSSATAKPYGYGAVEPVKLDEQGRIVAFILWPIQCGPPPPKNAKGQDTAFATLHPLPGLVMDKDSGVCTTTSTGALRNAARASKAWAGELRAARWIRDGDR